MIKRTPLKRKTPLNRGKKALKSSGKLRKVGKIGKANIESRKLIAKVAEEKNLTYCEIRLDGCMGTFGLAPAHRHRRGWYKGNIELLSAFEEWVCACQYCHLKIDANKKLLEETFKRLRP